MSMQEIAFCLIVVAGGNEAFSCKNCRFNEAGESLCFARRANHSGAGYSPTNFEIYRDRILPSHSNEKLIHVYCTLIGRE